MTLCHLRNDDRLTRSRPDAVADTERLSSRSNLVSACIPINALKFASPWGAMIPLAERVEHAADRHLATGPGRSIRWCCSFIAAATRRRLIAVPDRRAHVSARKRNRG